jgi:hypothetical protein
VLGLFSLRRHDKDSSFIRVAQNVFDILDRDRQFTLDYGERNCSNFRSTFRAQFCSKFVMRFPASLMLATLGGVCACFR